ncbi:MAG: cytochrome c [Acetobacteraceae bacterium]
MVFMPAFEDQLDDVQIVVVADYVLEHFGNPSVRVTPTDVKRLRHADVGFWTVRLISNIIFGTVIIVGLVILVLMISLFRRCRRRQR